MASKYNKTENLLWELLQSEHGGCDDNSCDLSAAMSEGYSLWAIELFAHCGAASEEFDALYAKLGPKFKVRAEKERAEFVANIAHFHCPHCNAVLWGEHDEYSSCDSCGKDCPKAAEVQVKSDGANSVSIKVAKDTTGTYGGFLYVTDSQAKDILEQLTDLGYAPISKT